jgi:hypothetical protein
MPDLGSGSNNHNKKKDGGKFSSFFLAIREMENTSSGSTFGDFNTIHREWSMQVVTVARL